MANTELQFEMAIRDQVIHNQREAQRNLWNLLMGAGLDQRKIMELAAKQGIAIEDWNSPYGPSVRIKYSPIQACGRFSPICSCPGIERQAFAPTACFLQHQHHQDYGSVSSFKGQRDGHTVCREEHHSYYLLSQEDTQSAYHGMRKQSEQWPSSNPVPCFYTPEKLAQDPCCYYPRRRALSFPCEESCTSSSSFHQDYSQQQKVCLHAISYHIRIKLQPVVTIWSRRDFLVPYELGLSVTYKSRYILASMWVLTNALQLKHFSIINGNLLCMLVGKAAIA